MSSKWLLSFSVLDRLVLFAALLIALYYYCILNGSESDGKGYILKTHRQILDMDDDYADEFDDDDGEGYFE